MIFYENSKTVPQGEDGADKNFRPISTIRPNMNEIYETVFIIWGHINFNAKTLTLWRKDERTYKQTNEHTYERTDERKSENYIPLDIRRGYNDQYSNLTKISSWQTSVIVSFKLWLQIGDLGFKEIWPSAPVFYLTWPILKSDQGIIKTYSDSVSWWL